MNRSVVIMGKQNFKVSKKVFARISEEKIHNKILATLEDIPYGFRKGKITQHLIFLRR